MLEVQYVRGHVGVFVTQNAAADAMIAASALLSGCDTLWSEDMQDGVAVDGRLRIVNPFFH